MDQERKGYITLEHFSIVLLSTQRLVNYIDEYAPAPLLRDLLV